MKRFHVHVAVPDLAASIRFYSTLFGAEPSVVKDDYAKWMLDDPRVNFAISHRGSRVGINHLGFQVDEAAELEDIRGRRGRHGREERLVLLRALGQVLDHRSRGRPVGVVPKPGHSAVL